MERPQTRPRFSATSCQATVHFCFIHKHQVDRGGRLLRLFLFPHLHSGFLMLVPSFPALVNGTLHASRNNSVRDEQDENRELSAGLFADKDSSLFHAPAYTSPSRSRTPRIVGAGSQARNADIFARQSRPSLTSHHSRSHFPSSLSHICSICDMQPSIQASNGTTFHSRTNSRDHSSQLQAPCLLGASYQQGPPTRHSFLCISEPDILPHDHFQYVCAQPQRTLRSCVSILADRARAVLVRVRTSFRSAPPPRRRLSPHSPLPRLSIYQTRSSADSSLSGLHELLTSPADGDVLPLPMPGAWLEPKDTSPHVDLHSTSPRPLSWPSIMPLSPDMPCDVLSASTLDFRTAADLVLDYDSTDLPFLQRDDGDEDTEDTLSLQTPLHGQSRPPFALHSTWSDSESEADCDDLEGEDADGFPGITFPLLPQALSRAREHERASISSLSLFPSPPGSPAFTERFSTVTQADPPSTPKRSRRSAVLDPYIPHTRQPFAEPESPTVRTARIRRETLARLESRVNQR